MMMTEHAQDLTLDPAVLEGYFRGNRKAREDFVAFFRSNLSKSLAALRLAVNQRNFKEIEYLAHRMRGSVGYVGAYKIARIFQRMEEQATLADAKRMEALLDEATNCQSELFRCM